ncbi:MAG TPA: PEP-CTERM sorting domain-containing protein [Geobacteraceae bacterium]
MKKLIILVCFMALGLQCNNAAALYVTNLNETFQSGATFSGTLTFNNSLTDLLSVSGTLSGAGYGVDPISWVWWSPGGVGGTSLPINGSNIYANFLMDGTPPGQFQHFIEIDWVGGGSSLILDSSLGSFVQGSPGNAVNYSDPMVSYHTSSSTVPEPGTFLFFGVGLAGLAFARKKFRK